MPTPPHAARMERLRRRLAALPSTRRAAFVALCAERLYPHYLAFEREEDWGDPAALRTALDRTWAHVDGDPLTEAEAAPLIAACEAAAPDTEDFGGLLVSPALDAASAAALALTSCPGGRRGGRGLRRPGLRVQHGTVPRLVTARPGGRPRGRRCLRSLRGTSRSGRRGRRRASPPGRGPGLAGVHARAGLGDRQAARGGSADDAVIRRVVAQLPLEEVWDERGSVTRDWVRDLDSRDVQALLREGPVHFVIADIGHPLSWVPPERRFYFWKDETRAHLIEPDLVRRGVRLDGLPDGYGFVASEWRWADGAVVLLSKWH